MLYLIANTYYKIAVQNSREKPYSSRECFSRPSNVCYVCGKQDHYKKVCPKIKYRKCYQKGHISRERSLRDSGYSSSHSTDRKRGHERRTEDRDGSPLCFNRRRYEDECSVSVGTVRSASCDKIIDGHYNSLFTERPSSNTVTRYGRVVKPVHREGTIYY